MRQPEPMMTASFEGPHCPTCHCAWFRTVGSFKGPLSTWVRQCKHCGTEYSTNESVMLVELIEGEANFEAVVRSKMGHVQTIQRPTMRELAGEVADLVVRQGVEVLVAPRKLRSTVEITVR